MVATSPDFKTWTKNRIFYLKGDTYGYDKNDFRDPFLFQTEDGVYHMLIATRKNGKGISPNLPLRPERVGICRNLYDHDVGSFLRMSGCIQDGGLVVSDLFGTGFLHA